MHTPADTNPVTTLCVLHQHKKLVDGDAQECFIIGVMTEDYLQLYGLPVDAWMHLVTTHAVLLLCRRMLLWVCAETLTRIAARPLPLTSAGSSHPQRQHDFTAHTSATVLLLLSSCRTWCPYACDIPMLWCATQLHGQATSTVLWCSSSWQHLVKPGVC